MDYVEACGWLSLDPDVSIDEDGLKKAYRKAAILEHPDKSSREDATSRFQSIQRAVTFLGQCVERGETGPNADLERTDADDDEEEDDKHYADFFDSFMNVMFFSHLEQKMRRGGDCEGSFGGAFDPFGFGVHVVFPGDGDDDDIDGEYERRERIRRHLQEEEEERIRQEEMHRHRQEQARKEEKARREKVEEEEFQRRMVEERKRAQATKEGREFFESWSGPQLQQEAARRGYKTKGLQQKALVELLIDDEAKKRKRRELKKKAPYLDEWVEIINVTCQPHLNGMKAKAIDFSTDTYTVEWENPSLKKKINQSRKQQTRLKPENLKLWGRNITLEPEPEQNAPQKKSRRARRQAAKRRQQEKEQHANMDQKPNGRTEDTTEPKHACEETTAKDTSCNNSNKQSGNDVFDGPVTATGGSNIHQKLAPTSTTPSKTPSTAPISGTSSPAGVSEKYDDKDTVTIEGKQPASPSFGSSGGFTFTSQRSGDKAKTFEFGSTNFADRPQQKAKNNTHATAEATKAEEQPSKREEKATARSTSKEPDKLSHATDGKSKSPSKIPKPENQSKATYTASYSEKEMKQFERLAKEVGDKVDLTNVLSGKNGDDDGVQNIQIKVKCPKNKRPGDAMEFNNPHVKGDKRRIVIPEGVKPGKMFKVLVPLPKKAEATLHCVCCSKIVVKHTAENNSEEKRIGIPLRACSHYCCDTCHLDVRKTCPSCKSPLPTLESLDPLPYIRDLDNPPDAVKKALLEEYYAKKEAYRLDTKVAKDLLEEASKAAIKSIDKHYRRASLKVHPDRFGEKYRKEFNALTKARDVFRSTFLRRKYLTEMLDIVCRLDVGFVAQSHKVWVENNDPHLQEKAAKPSTTGPKKGGQEAPLQLDGGFAFSIPKKPRIFIQSEKAQRIKLYLPLANEYQFLEYCQNIVVYGTCGYIDEKKVVLADIKRSKLNIFEGQIRCEVSLPENGIWDVSWLASLKMEGNEVVTPPSTEARVDLRTEAQRRLEHRKAATEKLALRATNDIKAWIRSPNGVGCNRFKQEERYTALHAVVARGRDVSMKLAELLRCTGESSSPTLTALLICLQEAVDQKKQLGKSLESYRKREGRRAFKETIATRLEQGDAEKWVSTVSVDELLSLGGNANRLYQLLIEGKKANSLAFNDTTVEAAERRSDLFTPKQKEALKRRRMELQALHAAELKCAEEEAVMQKAEEMRRKQMEKKAKSIALRFGDAVRIHGLVSRTDLNESRGTYLGFAQGDRYTVRLDRDGSEVALKAFNISVWKWKYDAPATAPPSTMHPKAHPFEEQHANHNEPGSAFDSSPEDFVRPESKENHVSNTVRKKNRKKQKKGCKFGFGCKYLKRGPTECQFYHSPEQISAFYPNFTGEGPGANLPEWEKQSMSLPTRSKALPEVSIDGTLSIHFASNVPSEQKTTYARTDDLSGLTGESSDLAIGRNKPKVVSPSSAGSTSHNSEDSGSLLQFLQSQKSCFKCTPARFHQGLLNDDVVSMEDLVKACEGEEYHIDLQEYGLKKFKRRPFLKAVKNATGGFQ